MNYKRISFNEEVGDLLVPNSDLIFAQKYDSKTQCIDCVKNKISVKPDKIHVKLLRLKDDLGIEDDLLKIKTNSHYWWQSASM